MTDVNPPRAGPAPPRSILFTATQLGLFALLVFACVRVVMPFVAVLLWSAILAIMLYPLHLKLSRRMGNKWSATLIGVVGALLLLAPMVLFTMSLASSLSTLVDGLQNNTLKIPPPPPRLAEVPLVGARITDAWAQAAANAPAAIAKYSPALRGPIKSLVGFVGGLGAAELSFMLSFIIAAVMVAFGKSMADFARKMVEIFTGSAERGVHMVALTATTVRGVAVGVVGVAAIQAALLGVGFFAIGLPGAGILTLIVFLLGVIQIPATLLTLPIIAYALTAEPIVPAAIFSVWTLVAGLSDNVLKPLMLGRGMEVPMPVILIGVIGGMVADGLLGLFVGPTILAVAYVLLVDWLRQQPAWKRPASDSPASASLASTSPTSDSPPP